MEMQQTHLVRVCVCVDVCVTCVFICATKALSLLLCLSLSISLTSPLTTKNANNLLDLCRPVFVGLTPLVATPCCCCPTAYVAPHVVVVA